jgi:predicted metal-dependent HD superfamily phosphohydrolase
MVQYKMLTMKYEEIIVKAGEYVSTYINEHGNLNLMYHNLTHTENVVTAVTEIAQHYKLNEKDFFICVVAAWFHDLGYYIDASNHVALGAKKADEFLIRNNIDEDTTIAIKGCIMATKFPQNPSNLLEQIVCDANLYCFGTEDFFLHNKLLRKETEALNHIKINKMDWRKSTIQIMENHHFYTDYCKEHLNKKKRENLQKLKKKAEKRRIVNPMEDLLHKYMASEQPWEGKIKQEVPEQPERGTETLFRIASGVSQRLNEQADTKAHILISVNSILISVILAVVVRRMEAYAYLTLPVIMFLAVNLLTIIFSVLTIRPSVADGIFNQQELDDKRVNLLFFGNFYQMNFDEYSKGMFQVIGDKHYLYLSLIRNLYDQGVLLGKKYRLLKVAYNIFMYGLVVSVIAFFIASKFADHLKLNFS